MSGKRRLAATAVASIVAFMALVMVGVDVRSGRPITESAKTISSAVQAIDIPAALAEPAAAATCATVQLTLKNQNPYTIWLGETVSGNVVAPPGNNWMLGANGGSVSLCVPADWTSGVFWARTQCDFTGTFGQDPDKDYVDCTSSSQCCTSGTICSHTGNPTLNNHVCVGGKCVIDCSPSGTDKVCSALAANSVCAAAGSAQFCGFPAGKVCKTGDCGSGLYQCQGVWDGNSVKAGAGNPASLFEITASSTADSGKGAANFDVSNVSSFNNPISVGLDFTPDSSSGPDCSAVSCVSDLNASCPALLQVIEPPAGLSGPISCGGAFCQSGVCADCPSGESSSCLGGKTCVIGCNAPQNQAGAAIRHR
jgi:hypothetical protein